VAATGLLPRLGQKYFYFLFFTCWLPEPQPVQCWPPESNILDTVAASHHLTGGPRTAAVTHPAETRLHRSHWQDAVPRRLGVRKAAPRQQSSGRLLEAASGLHSAHRLITTPLLEVAPWKAASRGVHALLFFKSLLSVVLRREPLS
jgi:hypothetical protein